MLDVQSRTEALPGADFREQFVDFDGFRIRYLEKGEGPPLVFFHGAGGLTLHRSHDLLAEQFRVLAFEAPGFGTSAVNERTPSHVELAGTLLGATGVLGLEQFNMWGTSFGAGLAFWATVAAPEPIQALELEAPGAAMPEGSRSPMALSPEELHRRLYAHPERQPKRP